MPRVGQATRKPLECTCADQRALELFLKLRSSRGGAHQDHDCAAMRPGRAGGRHPATHAALPLTAKGASVVKEGLSRMTASILPLVAASTGSPTLPCRTCSRARKQMYATAYWCTCTPMYVCHGAHMPSVLLPMHPHVPAPARAPACAGGLAGRQAACASDCAGRPSLPHAVPYRPAAAAGGCRWCR